VKHVQRARHRHARTRSVWSILAATAMAATSLALVPASQVQAAGPTLSLAKSGDQSVLVDAPISYTLTAHNDGSSRDYNLTFRDVLPVGVSYKAGSTSQPKGVGDPTVTTIGTPPNTQQVLVWSNVSDLPAGADQALSFQVTVDPALYPVGSTVENTGDVYAQSNPRLVPKFDALGNPKAGTYTDSATSTPFDTRITAITIAKSEASPEHELMRGVHDDTTTYTLKVTNNDYKATTGNTVVDFLPAGLEFLGCGGVDNGSTSEYAGRTLTGTPAPSGTCASPVSVDTVQLAAGNAQGLAAGVYTKVTWALPDLAAGETWTTNYRAGIPQRANTLDFGGTTPTAGSLDQASNLDNNTGADTREQASDAGTENGEKGLTNLAQVTGSYTGDIKGDPADKTVLDSSSVTVTAEDLAVQKSVSPGEFDQGGVATYTLNVETSEYAAASGITITDVIPDGMCPLSVTTGNSCAGSAADFTATNADVQSVTHNADNTWTVVFQPFDQSAQKQTTITYKALMRASYDGHGGDPTVSGDGYTNAVSLVGSTTTLGNVNAPDGGNVTIADVRDESSATITSGGPALSKTIMEQATPYACATGTYTDNDTTPKTDPSLRFRVGDRVCFTIRVNFSAGNSTKNPQVTDFLPDYVSYESGSATATGANNVATLGGDPSVDGNQLTWTVGDLHGSDRFVSKAGVFEWRVSAIVTQEPDAAPKPDITANLAKLTWTDTNGKVGFLRDQVDFSVGATPPVGIAKSHTGFASGVVGGDQVPYTITVSNQGTTANGNAVPMKDIAVRDLLPAGVDCSLVSAISDGGVCSAGVIDWTLAGPLAAGAQTTVTYTMTVPADPRVLTDYVNTTGVRSFDTDSNIGTTTTHHPDNTNSQLTTCGDDPLPSCDVPAAEATDKVTVRNTGLTKTQTTAIAEANNDAPLQAVIGEGVTYTVKATVPAHTTVYQGVVSDPLPTGVTALSAAADLDGGALPGGVLFASNATSATLTLPATYTNTTGTDQVFTITIQARVATDSTNKHGVTRTNTASFTRKDAATGGSNLPAQTASTTATIVEPNPKLAKSHTPSGKVSGGQVLTYTLTATNPAATPAPNNRPPLHDAYVVDCVPAGLNNVTVTTPGATTDTSAGDGTNGCPAGTTRLHWSVGDLAGGGSAVLKYTVVVDPAAVGGQVYTNNATIVGSDIADGTETTTPIERQYSAPATDSVTVVGSSLSKSNSTPLLAIGERARFTVTATVPANVNYYDATIVDTLPSGLDASKVQLVDATCTYADASACTVAATALTGSGQVIGWFLGDLTSDAKARTIVLTYTVPVKDLAGLAAGDALTNSALLGWDLTNKTDPTDVGTTPDTTAGPVTSTVHVTDPLVSITKGVSASHPKPGDSFTYTVSVSNANTGSTSTAYQVGVSDAVPTGVVVDPASISNGGTITGADPVTGGGTITWTLPSIAKGATTALTYSARLADPAPNAVLTNTANVTSYCSVDYTPLVDGSCAAKGGRPHTGPSATADVSASLPHVVVAKSIVGGSLAYLGTSKTFQVTITSDGSSKAFKVAAHDTLPNNWTYDAGSARVSVLGGTATAVEPTVSGQSLTWTNLGDLPSAGDTIVITYSATPKDPDAATDPGAGHTIDHTNTVGVTAQDANGKTADEGGHPYNGPDAQAIAHIDSADLQIVKSPVGTPVAGQDFSWYLAVTNNGPDAAVGPITVTDPMPGTLTSISASGSGWTCTVATSTITCTRSNSLPSGASYPVITVTGHVPATTNDGTHLVNTATVAGTTYDPKPGNNEDDSDVTVAAKADMTITKKLSGSLVAGQDATYTLDVTNNGPSVHRGPLMVTDDVPAGTTFVSASGANWTCTKPAVGATGTISCSRSDDIPLGATDQITVVVHVDSGRTTDVVNTGHVKGDNPGGTTDPDHTNDDSTVTTTPGTSADLSIDKSRVDDADFVAGKVATYLLTVHNDGPSDARNVTITDTLPSYLTFQGSTSADGWTCSAAGQKVTCSLTGVLPASPGDHSHDVAVKIKVLVAADHRGDIANTASVDSTTPDPVPGNNTDTDDLTDGGISHDFSIAKKHPAGSVVAGGNDVTYTLTVTNNGDSKHLAADGAIAVTDEMPAGMTCVSVTGGSCASSSKGTYSYTGDLAVGASFDVTVVAHIAADAGPGTLVNTAKVAGPNDDDPTNDTTTDTTTVVDQANVSLTKTVTGANPVRAGENTTFKLTAHNDGPSDADDVTIVDTLPAGMTLVSISGTGWTCTPATLTCTRPTLAAGADASITVEVKVGSGVADGASLVNHGTVSTTTDGDDPADNDAHADVDVVAEADIVLHKAHVGSASVVAGTDTSYTLDVHNAGPSDAQGPITITDTLPTGMSYLSADGGWSCSASGQVVTCTQSGPLLAGADATTLTMLVHVGADADVSAGATNTAHAESTTTDPVPGNNDDDATVTIVRGTDVSIVKSHTGTGEIGSQVDFTLAVGNAGPSTARGVTVRDPLPVGLEYVSADGGPDWTCTYDAPTRTVTCDHNGPIAANTAAADIHVIAIVHAEAYPSVTNVATVDTSTPDGDPTNNTSEDPVTVPSLADLSIVKSHTGKLVVGKQGHYTLTVHNGGPTEAAGAVTVTDTLPNGLTFVSATGSGWTCLNVLGAVTCTRAGLAAGTTSTIDLVVSVGAAAYPSVTNVASVSAPDADPDPTNNTSEDPGPVTPTVDLTVAKSVAYQRGNTVAWDIAVTNHGPSASVAPIVVVDKLPAALTYVSAGGSGWTCARVSATVTCTRTASLAADGTSTVRVVTTLHAAPGTTVRNVATVTGGGDPHGTGTGGGHASGATVKPSPGGHSGSGLPNTGGPAWWWAVLATFLVAGGGLLIRRRRRA